MVMIMNRYERLISLYFKSMDKFRALESQPRDFGTGDLLYRSETHTLLAIGQRPGTNLTEIAEDLGITKAGVTKFVKKLMDKGLIIKEQSPENKKEVYFYLTDKGIVVFQEHDRFSKAYFSKIHQLMAEMADDQLDFLEGFLKDLIEVAEENLKI